MGAMRVCGNEGDPIGACTYTHRYISATSISIPRIHTPHTNFGNNHIENKNNNKGKYRDSMLNWHMSKRMGWCYGPGGHISLFLPSLLLLRPPLRVQPKQKKPKRKTNGSNSEKVKRDLNSYALFSVDVLRNRFHPQCQPLTIFCILCMTFYFFFFIFRYSFLRAPVFTLRPITHIPLVACI